jgi:D-amino-acid dehydrogenase
MLWLLNFARHCNDMHLQHALQVRERILSVSDQLYHTLIQEEKLCCEWERRGVLIVCNSGSKMDAYAADNELLKPFGLAAKPYVGHALQAFEPALREDVCGAWHHESDSHLRPDTLLQEWKRNLIQRGVGIEEHCSFKAFRYDADRVEGAVTQKGTFSAGEYVLAAGAWSPNLLRPLKIDMPIQPGKGYSITMERPAICPQIPCILSEAKVVATPWSSGYRLGGTLEFSGYNTRVVPSRLENLKRAAREYLKMPLGEPLLEEWVGLRPMVHDDLPIIDRVPGKRNLFVATGHGMLGISLAPATGKLVSEMICNRPTHIDAAPFSLRRFGNP